MWLLDENSNSAIESYQNEDLGEIVQNKDLPNPFLKGRLEVRFAANPSTLDKTQLTYCEIGPHESYKISGALLKGSEKDFK